MRIHGYREVRRSFLGTLSCMLVRDRLSPMIVFLCRCSRPEKGSLHQGGSLHIQTGEASRNTSRARRLCLQRNQQKNRLSKVKKPPLIRTEAF